MTDDEYNALVFSAAAQVVYDLRQQIRERIRETRCRMPYDDEIDEAMSRAVASRYADFGRCCFIDNREGHA